LLCYACCDNGGILTKNPKMETGVGTTTVDDRYQALVQRFPLPQRTLAQLLQQQAQRYGARTLYQCQDEKISYAQALNGAQNWAAALKELGVKAGDRVALMASNRLEFLHVFFGCAWLGAVCVPINTASKGEQLAHILQNCGARLLWLEADYAQAVLALDIRALALRQIMVVGGDGAKACERFSHVQPGLQWQSAHDFHTHEAQLLALATPNPDAAVKPGDTLAILYTSGTTGPSKGVCCPHAQFFWWGLNTAQLLDLGEGEVLYSCLPLFHINALCTVVQALLTGSTFVIGTRFSTSRFLHELVQHQATATYLLGAMVPMLLMRNPEKPSALRTRIALAPGVPAEHHIEFVRRFGIGIVSGFGSTETNFVVGEKLADTVPGLMGRVRPNFEARVVDEFDAPVAAGTAGELVLRASEPFAFASGYFGMPDKTVQAWQNLWFHTGDRVVCDSHGRLRFLDRIKDAIRRRGENISAFEVEAVLNNHPDVALSAVFAVPSGLGEDEVMAVIVREKNAAGGAAPSFAALLRYCAEHLPYFAVPRYFEVLAELPVTENGKVQKFKLRERGVSAQTWDSQAHGYAVTRRGVTHNNKPETDHEQHRSNR